MTNHFSKRAPHLAAKTRPHAFKKVLSVSAVFAALTLGCSGKTLDLDAPTQAAAAGASANSADVVLLSRSDDPIFGQLTVDDERIYWITDAPRVQSCLKEDCAHSVVTYARDSLSSGDERHFTPSVSSGHVFWLGGDQSPTIYSCPRAGCKQAPFAIVRDPFALELTSDQDYVYWASSLDLYRCSVAGCAATPEVVARGEGTHPVFSGEDAFWISPSSSASSARPIRRAPKDGSGTPTTVVEPTIPSNLRVFGDALYWIGDDGINTCSINGCNGEPRIVASDQVMVGLYDETLNVDASGAYWLDTSNVVQYCPLDGCNQATAVTPSTAQSFALDADYVYWTDNNPDTGGFQGLNIHRLPKPKAP